MSKLKIYPIDPTLSTEEKILFIENVMNQIIADYEPLEFPETSSYPQLNAIEKVHEQSLIELHELMRELAEKLLIRINELKSVTNQSEKQQKQDAIIAAYQILIDKLESMKQIAEVLATRIPIEHDQRESNLGIPELLATAEELKKRKNATSLNDNTSSSIDEDILIDEEWAKNSIDIFHASIKGFEETFGRIHVIASFPTSEEIHSNGEFINMGSFLWNSQKACLKGLIKHKEYLIPIDHHDINEEFDALISVLDKFFEGNNMFFIYYFLDLYKISNPHVVYENIEAQIKHLEEFRKKVDFIERKENLIYGVLYEYTGVILALLSSYLLNGFKVIKDDVIPQNWIKFQEGQELGSGGEGTVNHVEYEFQQFAVKKFTEPRKVNLFIKKLYKIRHPNIVKIPRGFEDNSYILELCKESLTNYIVDKNRYISRYLYVSWLSQLIDGMSVLHSNNLIHRDLKPDNLLLDEGGNIKICDFDNACELATEDKKVMSTDATIRYMAPEYLTLQLSDFKIDVWSYGVIAWQIFTREKPFDGVPEVKIPYLVVEKGLSLILPKEMPQLLKEHIKKCLEREPEKRPSFNEILEDFKPVAKEILNMKEDEWHIVSKQSSDINQIDTRIQLYATMNTAPFVFH